MMVKIAIEEGPRFDYGAIDFQGDMLGTPAQHLALIRSRPGATFVRSMVEADRKALEMHYQDLGFASASVAPRPHADVVHHRIAIDFEIVRGKRVVIERISIRGNSKTRDKVIRREMRIAEVVAAADRVVPVLGVYDRADNSTEAPLVALFDALTIRGAKPGKAPLYASSDLAGDWSTMDSSYGRYVDSQGHDVGDASMTVAQTYRLDHGGTFQSSLVALRGSGANFKETHAGTWKVDDDSLVLDAKDIHRRIRIFGIGPSPKSGKPALYLPQSYAGSEVVDFWMPRRNKAEWFGRIN